MDYLEARWSKLWHDLGAPMPVGSYEKLVSAYDEPHRRYHTMLHISNSLEMLDWHHFKAHDPLSVELAIWLHDFHYDVRSSENEERSALFASEMLSGSGLHARAKEVGDLIRSTDHSETFLEGDFALLSDIDLSILGTKREVYNLYASEIRSEYAHVPESLYCSKRAEILESFMRRKNIYHKASFRDQYQAKALSNMRAEVLYLKLDLVSL